MNFEEMDLDSLSENEIIKLFNDIVDSGDTEDKLHILASCSIANGHSYCKSDRRLKDNITDNTSGLKEINSLNIKNYIYKEDLNKTPHVGVIAQELKTIFPNAVIEDEKGFLSIRTEDIFFAMVNSIKELSAKNEKLEEHLEIVINKLNRLELENLALRH